jgi:hypothetical protein
MSLTLSDDTPTNSTYKVISQKASEMILRDSASTLDNPRTFRISHQTSTDPNGTDRHLAQCVRVDDDSDDMPQTGSVHVVGALPREGVTSANLKLEWEKLKNFVDDNWDDFVGGFFPET